MLKFFSHSPSWTTMHLYQISIIASSVSWTTMHAWSTMDGPTWKGKLLLATQIVSYLMIKEQGGTSVALWTTNHTRAAARLLNRDYMSSPISICYIELILEPVKKRICGSATFRFPPSEPLLLKENPVVSGILFCDVSIFFFVWNNLWCFNLVLWILGAWCFRMISCWNLCMIDAMC